jgi:hypothetical protein
MLRHILEERLRLGEDVTGHGRRRADPLGPDASRRGPTAQRRDADSRRDDR